MGYRRIFFPGMGNERVCRTEVPRQGPGTEPPVRGQKMAFSQNDA